MFFTWRECSIQGSSKINEEAPSPSITDASFICNLAVKAANSMKYQNLGTIEFLYENGEFIY